MSSPLLNKAVALFCLVQVISSPIVEGYGIQADQSGVLRSIFKVEYQLLNSTRPRESRPLPQMCSSTKTMYKLMLPSDGNKNLFRVPHSEITEDEAPCGDQSVEKDRLWVQDHMVLAPYWMMQSEEIAREAGGDAVAMQFAFMANFRRHLQVTASGLEEQVSGPGDMWIGYESGDRVCNRTVALKAGTFILFARTNSPRVLNETHQDSGAIKLRIELQDPTKEVGKILNPEDTTYVYLGNTDIHLAFNEVAVQEPDDYDMICPFETGNDQRNADSGSSSGLRQSTASCFPADAKLTKEGGSVVTMSDLRIGDKVLDIDGSFTDIFLFTHRDSSPRFHTFVELMTEGAASNLLVLSPGHYVHTLLGLEAARDIQIGFYVIKASGEHVRVVQKRFVARPGLFNPQSVSGSIVVDGFAVSAYTTAVQPKYAHALLAPFRELYSRTSAKSFIRQVGLGSLFANGAGRFDWLVVNLLGVSPS